MNTQFKISQVLTGIVIAGFLLAGCQKQEEPVTLDELYDQGLSVEEIASLLNAIKLDPSDLEYSKKDDNGMLAKSTEIIKFDDGGVCDIQEALDLPGCATGAFSDPLFPYFYTLDKAYFYVHHSLGPDKGLAEAGDQTYVVASLNDPNYNHSLLSPGNRWTKYSMRGSSATKKVHFDLETIRSLNSGDITLYFIKDGRWWYWSNLGTGNWNVSAHMKGVTEFQIRASSGNTSDYYRIDDIVVTNLVEK